MEERELSLLNEISQMTDEEFRSLIEEKKKDIEKKKDRKAVKNYIRLRSQLWPFTNRYMVADVPDHYTEQILPRHGLSARVKGDYYRGSDERYVLVMVKVKKKRVKDFLLAMDELKRKMILLGRDDYEEYCRDMWWGIGFLDEDAQNGGNN